MRKIKVRTNECVDKLYEGENLGCDRMDGILLVIEYSSTEDRVLAEFNDKEWKYWEEVSE